MPGSTESELILLQSVVQPQHRLHEPVDHHVCLSKPRCTSRSTRRFPRSQVDTFSRVPPWEHQYAIVPSRLHFLCRSPVLTQLSRRPCRPQTRIDTNIRLLVGKWLRPKGSCSCRDWARYPPTTQAMSQPLSVNA